MAEPLTPKTPPDPPAAPAAPPAVPDLSAAISTAVSSALGEFQKKIDERFEGMSKKNQERFASLEGDKPKPNGQDPATDPKPPGDGGPDVNSIIATVRTDLKLEAAIQGLDETARKRVESIKTDHGAAAALAVAEGLGQAGGAPATGGPNGDASPANADAATQSPPDAQRFDSYDEWSKFRRTNPDEALRYRRTHKSFNPFKLKGAPRQTWEADDDPPVDFESQASA